MIEALRFFLCLPFMFLAYAFWKIAYIIRGKPFVIGRKYYDSWKVSNVDKLQER